MDNGKINGSKFPALQYRDFRLLWIALLISNIGSQMQFAAVNWHIYVLTHSAVALGLVGLARFIPVGIFALVGGSVADAHNRKKVLLITQTSLAIIADSGRNHAQSYGKPIHYLHDNCAFRHCSFI